MTETTTRSEEVLIQDFESDKAHNESESTAKTHSTNLELFRKWLSTERDKQLLEAQKRDVREYLRELKADDYANKTIGIRYTAVQVFYRWLESEGAIAESPTENLKSGVDTSISRKEEELRSDTPPAVTEREKELLCENIPNPKLRNELIIRVLFQTGIRAKELRNIRLNDLDREERSILIDDAKSNKYRKVYYNDLEPWISEWLDRGNRASLRPASESEYLFLTNRSKKLSMNRPNRTVRQAAENAGIQETLYTDQQGGERKRITTHSLRHGFARHCVQNGMDISYLQELLGHENLETTKVYLNFTDQDKRDALRKYGPSPN